MQKKIMISIAVPDGKALRQRLDRNSAATAHRTRRQSLIAISDGPNSANAAAAR